MRSAVFTIGLMLSSTVAWAEAPDLTQLVGKIINLQLQNGKMVEGAEVTKVTPGAEAGSVKSLLVKYGKPVKSQSVSASLIAEIFLEGQTLDIELNKKTKTIAHSPERREARLKHLAEVEERLSKARAHLWPDLSPQEHEEWIAKHKAFMKDVAEKMPSVKLELVETKYYLFYTDMPLQSVAIFIAYLDSMYDQLSAAFAIPAGKNIFCGKCVVVAFSTEGAFKQFETVVYQNEVKPGTAGLCHSNSSGAVVISCYKMDTAPSFADVLVHETAHGFVHRWLSSARIPSWINEGVSDWVAGAVVKESRSVANKQEMALERIRQTGSLGGNFFQDTGNIDFAYYGTASHLVEFLLRIDASKYRRFLTNIKEGMSADESLKDAYNMTTLELLRRYGTAVGIPNLQP